MYIKINNEVMEVTAVRQNGDVYNIEADGKDFVIFKSQEDAGKAAREYWEDMAENDKSEFACMVGKESLVSWALGQYAGPGQEKVKSLSDWLDLYLNVPEEHFASYDGEKRTVESFSRDFIAELGDNKEWIEAARTGQMVAYRTN